MRKPRGKGWRLLGKVGVDSGQLMVCDPTYIDSEWKPNTEPPGHAPVVLTDKGKKRFPGNKDWSWRFNGYGTTYDSPQTALGGLSINDAIEQKLAKPTEMPLERDFSYRGACSTSMHGGGALKFKLGHDGAGVVFSSGYGDGCYEVWARENEEGRIAEVRILMC